MASADPSIYKDIKIENNECCSHVQKRMGHRLRDLVQANRGKLFTGDYGKKYIGIEGMSRLTQKAILSIQGHCGAAIKYHLHERCHVENFETQAQRL